MSWFIFAFLGAFLWAIGNFIDKILTTRFGSENIALWTLMLYSSLFSILLLPVLFYWRSSEILASDPVYIFILIAAGLIEMVGIILYLKVLMREDASTVVPFFQSIPVFSFILGYLVLGEMLHQSQILAGLGVILGGVLLSLEISSERKVRFNGRLISLMLLSSVCYALFDTLFKVGGLGLDFWPAVFWQHVGITLTGIAILIWKTDSRRQFIRTLRDKRPEILGLNMLNELLYVAGIMLTTYALLLAPIALVATLNVYHPVLVFIFGIILTLLVPKLIREKITLHHLLQKTFAIGIIVISSIFLVLHS